MARMRWSGFPRCEKSGGVGTRRENPVSAQQDILRGILLDQSALVARKAEQKLSCALSKHSGGHVAAQTKQSFLPNSGAGKIDVLDDVVQGDVGEIAQRAGQCRCGTGRQRRPRDVPGVAKLEKTRLNQTTSGFNFRMVLSETDRSRQAVEFPAADHVEAGKFLAFAELSGLPFSSVANS